MQEEGAAYPLTHRGWSGPPGAALGLPPRNRQWLEHVPFFCVCSLTSNITSVLPPLAVLLTKTTLLLFCYFVHSSKFWSKIENLIVSKCNRNIVVTSQNVLIYFEHDMHNLDFIVNLIILLG